MSSVHDQIDLHCHLLSGIDDGPNTIQAALAMARVHIERGIGVVACTPHVDWNHENTAEGVRGGVVELRAELERNAIPLRLVAGAEVGLSRAMDMTDDELVRLRLGDGPWLLLEAPLKVSVGVEQAVSSIASRGHSVLLAHPERCPAIHRDPTCLLRIVDAGALVQITATSLTGAFGATVARLSRKMVVDGLVHVVASDAHDVQRRPPGITEHLDAVGLGEHARFVASIVPTAILNGDRIPAPPALEPKSRSRLKRWLGS